VEAGNCSINNNKNYVKVQDKQLCDIKKSSLWPYKDTGAIA
jgi:hypothetical protein